MCIIPNELHASQFAIKSTCLELLPRTLLRCMMMNAGSINNSAALICKASGKACRGGVSNQRNNVMYCDGVVNRSLLWAHWQKASARFTSAPSPLAQLRLLHWYDDRRPPPENPLSTKRTTHRPSLAGPLLTPLAPPFRLAHATQRQAASRGKPPTELVLRQALPRSHGDAFAFYTSMVG